MSLMRPLGLLCSTALVTAATLLTLGAPRLVNAVDASKEASETGQAEADRQKAPESESLKPNEARVDALKIEAELKPSEAAKSRWVVALKVHNPTDAPIATVLELALNKTSGGGGRVSPPPQLVWHKSLPVEVGAGQDYERAIEVPKAFATQLAWVAARQAANEKTGTYQPLPFFFAEVTPPQAKPAQLASGGGSGKGPLVAPRSAMRGRAALVTNPELF